MLYRISHRKRYRQLRELRYGANKHGYSFLPFLENECLFVHIPKCGGTSISQALFGNAAGGHIAMNEYVQAFNSFEFNRYFKFTVVRNPWARLVSGFYFLKQGNWDPKGSGALGSIQEYEEFDRFVKGWLNPDNIRRHNVFRPQSKFLFRGDKLMVDFVGYLENIEDDFRHIQLQIGSQGELNHLNRGRLLSKGYQDYYTDETIQIVGNLYRDDVENFGYRFDNSSIPAQIAARNLIL